MIKGSVNPHREPINHPSIMFPEKDDKKETTARSGEAHEVNRGGFSSCGRNSGLLELLQFLDV